jgi:hypothetical protein
MPVLTKPAAPRRPGRENLLTAMSPHFRRTGVTEYLAGARGSLRLNVEGPDHLAPFLGLVGDELAEIGR